MCTLRGWIHPLPVGIEAKQGKTFGVQLGMVLSLEAWAAEKEALGAQHPACGVNPVLQSRLSEQIFPLVTSLKMNGWGRASQREHPSQEQRAQLSLWRGPCCFKQHCLLQQSKNSQGRGGGCSGSSQMEKRPFLSLAQQQGVSSALSEQSREPMCVLPAASPCLPPGSAPALAGAGAALAQKQSYGEEQQPGEGWRRSPAWQLLVTGPPTRWQSRHRA